MQPISTGKVRELYSAGDDKLVIVTTDRVSAYDVILPTAIDGKGIYLNRLSEFWFEFTKEIIGNHLISCNYREFPAPFCDMPQLEGRAMLVKKLKMLPVECVVRGYLTGSGYSSYLKDSTVCGIELPKGLRESEKLPEVLFTPTSKAETGHDESMTYEQLCALLGDGLAKQLKDKSIEIYKKCADYALTKGIIIADTKFEFGLDENGCLTLGDEVLTPDSSRFWSLESYEAGRSQKSFDKQYLRDWLRSNGLDGVTPAPELPSDVTAATRSKYAQACEILIM